MKVLKTTNIQEITCFELGNRPVFKVDFTNNARLVIKAEQRRPGDQGRDTERNIRFEGQLMKSISAQVDVQLLSAQELQVLQNLPANQFGPAGQRQAVKNYLLAQFEAGAVLYKMPFVPNLRKLDDHDQTFVARLIRNLRDDDKALRNLGKIVAIDLFNGNEDRFDIYGGIANEGNFLFQDKSTGGQEKFRPVGLDFYSDRGLTSDFSKDPFASGVEEWGGLWLRNENQMRSFASTALGSLNTLYNQLPGVNAADHDPLGTHAQDVFVAGMQKGVQALKAHLAGLFLIPGRKVPAGIQGRLFQLGWTATTLLSRAGTWRTW